MSLPVLRLTLHALLGRRRTLALGLLAVTPALVAVVYALAAPADSDQGLFLSRVVQQLFLPTVAAVVALIFGVSVIGDEREDGTILYLAATPLSRLRLVSSKAAAAWIASLVLLLPSLVATEWAVLDRRPAAGLVGWTALAVVLAALAYCAVAALLSLCVRRPIVVGVLYVVLWEGSVATFAPSAAKLSISSYARVLAAERLPQAVDPITGAGAAVAVLAAVSAAACALGAWRARRVELP